MKNLLTFEEFVNENKNLLLEKKTLSPANVKQNQFSRKGVNALKKWKYKLKDFEITYSDFEYYTESELPRFLEGSYKQSPDYLKVKVNNELELKVDIDRSKDRLSFDKTELSYNAIKFNIDTKTFSTYVLNAEDPLLGFVDLLTFLFDKYASEMYDFFTERLNLPILHVIPVGKIAPATGKTPHGWSIYDNPTSVIGMFNKYSGVYAAGGTFKVGDKFKVVHDQNGKILLEEITINEIVPCNYDEFIQYSKSVGAQVPVGAYKKQTSKYRIDIYSVK